MVGVNFHPYGQKSSVSIRYFPSVQTENSELLHLISVRTDGNLQLNFPIFRP